MNLESTNPIDYESDKRKRKVLVDLGDNGVGFSSSQTTKLSRQPKKKIISSDVENLDPVLHSINQASQQRCSSGSSTSKKGGSSSSSADSQCNPRTDVVFARNVRGPSDRPINSSLAISLRFLYLDAFVIVPTAINGEIPARTAE
uniref:Uncharacterized protein n=1 Tax=Leptocylindrus danicus TaxID=163516 RepID=A0A7S2PJ49_9STRA